MQKERHSWGIDTGKQLMLTGIVDTTDGRLRLDNQVFNSALAYDEWGLPHKVPPDATIVYWLRIPEKYPQDKTVARK